jgi:hypothetical protein
MFPSTGSPLIAVLLCASLLGCSLVDDSEESLEQSFTFEEGREGWTGAFSDFSEIQESSMELTFDRRRLPGEIDSTRFGLLLPGRPTSDDLLTFLKRKMTGLAPETTYELRLRMQIASASPSDCGGIGGPPGEAVYLKIGAAAQEPVRELEDGDYRLSVDKGNQSNGGDRAVVVGNAANGSPECSDTPYRMIERDNLEDPLTVRTDGDGSAWIFVGSDSGFEGTTSLFYDQIEVVLEPVD